MKGYWLFIKKGLLVDKYTYKFNGRYIGQDRAVSQFANYGFGSEYTIYTPEVIYNTYGFGANYTLEG